jgi:hypothetical protein
LLLLLLLIGWLVGRYQKLECLLDLVVEVTSVSEKLLEVDCLLVEKHTCQAWGVLLAVTLSNDAENAVTNELGLCFTFKGVKLVQVAVW